MNKLLIVLILLGGCATSSDMHLSDGSIGHNISCHGSANSVASCYQKAGELCGAKGYVVYGKDEQATPFMLGTANQSASPYMFAAPHQNAFLGAGMMVTRNLTVRCKD